MSITGVQLAHGARIRIKRGDTAAMTGAVKLIGVGDFDMPGGEAAQQDVQERGRRQVVLPARDRRDARDEKADDEGDDDRREA